MTWQPWVDAERADAEVDALRRRDVLVRLFTSEGIDLGVFSVRATLPPARISMDEWQTPGAVEHVREWPSHLTIPEYRFSARGDERRRVSGAANSQNPSASAGRDAEGGDAT